MGAGNFVPFLALHEYEAWLFADSVTVPQLLTQPQKQAQFAAITQAFEPEDINESAATAPSKRLLAMFPGYRKVLHGTLATERIGLTTIRARCPHFAAWMERLEAYAAA